MKLIFLYAFLIFFFAGKHLSEATKCGLCEPRTSKSPEVACTKKLSTCVTSTNCGVWGWKRCTRYKSCDKTELNCCRGNKKGSYCEVSGCGGCNDRTVLNQPACYRSVVNYTYRESYTYYVTCGGSWWRRTRSCPRTAYRVKAIYKQGAYCCGGFKLAGNRCVRQ